MHSRPDRPTSNCPNLALPFLAFPYHAQCPSMGTSSSQIDSLRIISALIACKWFHEFDRTLSQELVKTLQRDLAGFYLYSESDKAFAPVSALTRLTDMVSLFKALGGGWAPSPNRNPA